MNNRIEQCEVALKIPPGDYTDIDDKKGAQFALSNDLSNIINGLPNIAPSLVYVTLKSYFSERKNLHRLIDKNIKRACVTSVIVTLMSVKHDMMDDDDISDKELIRGRELFKNGIADMKKVLKSQARLDDFDSYSHERYQVVSQPVKFDDDGSYVPSHLDKHLNGEA